MSIEHLSNRLAEAEADLAQAAAIHHEAQTRADAIRSRIGELEGRRQDLKVRRINGAAQPSDDGELLLLAGDIDLLRERLVTAQAEADALRPGIQQSAYESAKFAFDRAAADERLAILISKAQETEGLFLRLCAEIQEAGRAVSKPHLSHCWTPSRDFRRAVAIEWPPA